MMQHALIHMQPLNARRQPILKHKFVGTLPRDGEPHRISGHWDLDKEAPGIEMPYYVRVWADDKSKDFEIVCAPPTHLRHLNSITFTQDLAVLPRRQ